jgi:hypothetical protein
MVSGRIAGWISFGFYDPATDAPSGQIVDYHFANQETREFNGAMWKLGSTQPAKADGCR